MSREVFSVVTTSGDGVATGVYLVQARDAAECPAVYRTCPPQPRIAPPQVSAVPRLRSPAMEEEKQNAVHSGLPSPGGKERLQTAGLAT